MREGEREGGMVEAGREREIAGKVRDGKGCGGEEREGPE